MKNNLIFLCGFMGCGKTTHGKKLAKILNYTFVDVDEAIVNQQDQSITEIFAEKGETGFRDLETDTIKDLIANNTNLVIALGGGAPCFNNNLELLKQNGMLIYIHLTPKALFSRLIDAKDERPLLKNKSDEELLTYIEELLNKRESYYQQAHLTVEGIDLDLKNLKEEILNFKIGA